MRDSYTWWKKGPTKSGKAPRPSGQCPKEKKSHAMCSLTFCNVVLQGSPWPSKLLQGSSIWQLDREGNLAKRTVVLRKNIIKLYLPKLIEKDCKSRKASLKIYLPATTKFSRIHPYHLSSKEGRNCGAIVSRRNQVFTSQLETFGMFAICFWIDTINLNHMT